MRRFPRIAAALLAKGRSTLLGALMVTMYGKLSKLKGMLMGVEDMARCELLEMGV